MFAIDDPAPGMILSPLFGDGNSLAVDLIPMPGGSIGQVIVIEPDEEERRVPAPGIAALLLDAAARRPALDDGKPPHKVYRFEPF